MRTHKLVVLFAVFCMLVTSSEHLAAQAVQGSVITSTRQADPALVLYANAVVKGDSTVSFAVRLMTLWIANKGGMDPDSMFTEEFERRAVANAQLFHETSQFIGVAHGNLKAVVPPTDLVAIHTQLLQRMQSMQIAFLDLASVHVILACQKRLEQGLGCPRSALLMQYAEGTPVALVAYAGASGDYQLSRQRLSDMLREQHVNIPPFASGSGAR